MCNRVEDRPRTHAAEFGKLCPSLEPNGGISRQASPGSSANQRVPGKMEMERPTVKQTSARAGSLNPLTSPPGRPPCDESPTPLSMSGSTALELMDEGLKAVAEVAMDIIGEDEARGQPDEPVRAESRVRDESMYARRREEDDLENLDARARTLLEDCRQLLAPASTISYQVSSLSNTSSDHGQCSTFWVDDFAEGLEKRVWMLLNEERPVLTTCAEEVLPAVCNDSDCFLEARRGLVALRSIDEASMVDESRKNRNILVRVADVYTDEGGGEGYFQHDLGGEAALSSGVRDVDNVNLESVMDHAGTRVHSLPPHEDFDNVSTKPTSEMDSNDAQERISSITLGLSPGEGWLRKDPVLSVLLGRLHEVETELERRRNLKPKGE